MSIAPLFRSLVTRSSFLPCNAGWSLGMAALAAMIPLTGQPASAMQLKTFDLLWAGFNPGNPDITGTITLDLDLVQSALPYNDPNNLPNWLYDLVINVPGPAPYGGTFQRSDYSGLIWDNRTDAADIAFDFTSNLVGQQGWGTVCPFNPGSGSCNFRLLVSDPNTSLAPYSDSPFQMYTRTTTTGSYAGLREFTPSAPTASVPAPLPIFGAGSALVCTRRLRRRARQSP